MFRIRDYSIDDACELDEFIESHPNGLLYYSTKYRKFLIEITGAKSIYKVAISSDGSIVGVLPIMSMEGPYGSVLNALPFFGSYGCPLAVNKEAHDALVEDWNKMVKQKRIASATMIANPLAPDLISGVEFNAQDYRYSQFTALPKDGDIEGEILEMVDDTARRNIKRAIKEDIEVIEDSNQLPFLEKVHRLNMKTINGLPKPSKFFGAIDTCFRQGDDWRLYVALKEGEPVAAVLLLYANHVVEYFTPAITDEGRKSQATALILLKAMTEAAKIGYSKWNWGGTWPDQEGVLRFKRKWGAEKNAYTYHTYIANNDLLKTTPKHLMEAYPQFYVLPFKLLGIQGKLEGR